MKLSEFRKTSVDNTKKASEISRQMSLAGVGIIWIFKNSDGSAHLLHPYLIYPLLFLALSLLLDLMQYIVGGIIWISFFRKQERNNTTGNSDPEVKAPEWFSMPIYALYYTKMGLMVAAYLFLLVYVAGKL